MTPELAFRACELSDAGLWAGRIAALLGVDEQVVRRALRGDTFDEALDLEPEPASTGDETAPSPALEPVRDPNAWPPLADESTSWREIRLGRMRGTVGAALVREVPLGGGQVLIDETGRVYCPVCDQMRTLEQLSAPDNARPVGVVRSSRPIMSFDASQDDGPRYVSIGQSSRVDFMREPW